MLWQSTLREQVTLTDSAKARFDRLQYRVPTGLLAERSPLCFFLGFTFCNPQRCSLWPD